MLCNCEKDCSLKNILSFLAFAVVMIGSLALVTSCGESQTEKPEKPATIQEQLMDQGNHFTQLMAEPAGPKFAPRKREFTLEDGTRCVMFSTPPASSRRAGSSGVSCNWNWEKSE